MSLSDTAIRHAKPGMKPVRLFDGGGLYVEVVLGGGKWWRADRFDALLEEAQVLSRESSE